MKAFGIAALVLLAGCSTHRPQSRVLGQAFSLPHGESVAIRSEGLTVAFTEVNEDSRCPTGATCITAGQASVTLRLAKSASDISVLLTIPGDANAEFEGYTVTLLDLLPYPSIGHALRPEEYAASLLVERR